MTPRVVDNATDGAVAGGTVDGVGHELGHQQLVLFHGDAPWELGVNPRSRACPNLKYPFWGSCTCLRPIQLIGAKYGSRPHARYAASVLAFLVTRKS